MTPSSGRTSLAAFRLALVVVTSVPFLVLLGCDLPVNDGAPGDIPAHAGVQEAGSEAAAPELEPHSVLERQMAAGDRHTFDLRLERGDYIRLFVEQRGVDVVLALEDPSGRQLIEVDSPTEGPERLDLVAVMPGRHRLEVRPLAGDSAADSPGTYVLRVDAWHAASPADRDRAAASTALAKAEDLRRRNEPQAASEALEAYHRAAEHWQAAGETLQRAVALQRVGRVHRQWGELGESIHWYQEALAQYSEADPSNAEIASILSRLGTLHRVLGELEKALAFYRQALAHARRIGDGRREAAYLSNIGLTYKKSGRTQQALTFYEKAMSRWRELGVPSEETRTLANVAQLYSWLGQHDRARILLEYALQVARKSGDRAAEANVLSRVGAVKSQLGRPREALSALDQALAIYRQRGDRLGEAVALKEIGRTWFVLGESEAARRSFEEALRLFGQLQHLRNEAAVRCDLGWIHLERREADAALAHFEAALAGFARAGSRTGEASAHYSAARAERLRGDPEAARRHVEAALAVVESLRDRTDVLELRRTLLAGKQDYYELYVDVLMDLHRGAPAAGWDVAAFEAVERRRARALLDAMAEAAPSRTPPDEGLRVREDALLRSIDDADRKRRRLLEKASSDHELIRVRRELEELLMALENLRGEIRRLGPAAPPLPVLDLGRAQELLDEETLLLSYMLGEERSRLWLLTAGELRHYELPPRAEIERWARDAHLLLSRIPSRQGRGRLSLVTAELSRVLLEPVAGQLGTKRRLVVSDGALQYLPLAALPVPGALPAAPDGAGRLQAPPMVTAHEIVHLPSLSVLAALRRQRQARRPPSGLVAVVADPVFRADDVRLGRSDERTLPAEAARAAPALERLVASRAEAEAILALVPEGKRLALLDFDASREAVTDGVLRGYRFVHFATHGLFDPQRPELSGLVLSLVDERGRPRDGFLRPHEIYSLDLPAEMVVLSACRSGLGKEVRGEGLVGLAQGLFHAGAARVTVSLWPVDDAATAELMKRFYEGLLNQGLRPAAALRSAQLSLLRDTGWKAPYYWAGFLLQGEWR